MKQEEFVAGSGASMTGLGSPRRRALALFPTAAAVLAALPALAQQKPNTAESLLRQCEAYVAHDAEVLSQMTCENTIWSTLRAMEASKSIESGFKTPYCKPEGRDIPVAEAARLYVVYVNTHPELLREPAEKAVLLAVRSVYPCPH